MGKIDNIVDNLIAQYIENLKDYDWTREKVYIILCDFKLIDPQKIYSITGRIKEVKSLKEKLLHHRYRDKLLDEEKPKKIEHLVKDLVGLRIVCYYKQDLKDSDGLIRNRFELDPVDIPEIYTINPKDAKDIFTDSNNRDIELDISTEGEKIYLIKKESNEKRFKIKTKDSKYTGIHYIVYLKDDELNKHPKIPIEIQLRTMLQEAWSELEHDISYKYPKVDVQEFFPDISVSLQASDDLIKKIKQKVVKKFKEFIVFLKFYYELKEEYKNIEIIELLLRGKELDKTKKSIIDLFDKIESPLLGILKLDIKLKTLTIIVNKMDLYEEYEESEILYEIREILLKIFLENIIKTKQYNIETIISICKIFLENNPEVMLRVLNNLPTEDLPKEICSELDNLLREVWNRNYSTETELLINIIDVLFEKGQFWNFVEIDKRIIWENMILEYVNTCNLSLGVKVIRHLKPSIEKYKDFSYDTCIQSFIQKIKTIALKRNSQEIKSIYDPE
jgi:ppGpp synthetase/RelA/SpoT-type nucleotidyltranferase